MKCVSIDLLIFVLCINKGLRSEDIDEEHNGEIDAHKNIHHHSMIG